MLIVRHYPVAGERARHEGAGRRCTPAVVGASGQRDDWVLRYAVSGEPGKEKIGYRLARIERRTPRPEAVNRLGAKLAHRLEVGDIVGSVQSNGMNLPLVAVADLP